MYNTIKCGRRAIIFMTVKEKQSVWFCDQTVLSEWCSLVFFNITFVKSPEWMLFPKIGVVVAEGLIQTHLSTLLFCCYVAEHVHLYSYFHMYAFVFVFVDKWVESDKFDHTPLLFQFAGHIHLLYCIWVFEWGDEEEQKKNRGRLPHCHQQPHIHQALSTGRRAARRRSLCTQSYLIRVNSWGQIFWESFKGISKKWPLLVRSECEKHPRRKFWGAVEGKFKLEMRKVEQFQDLGSQPCLRVVSRWSSWGGRGGRWPQSTWSPCRWSPPCRSPEIEKAKYRSNIWKYARKC